MKHTSALITLLLFSLFANAQLKGDHGIFAKTPLALKKNQFQFEYTLESYNYANANKGFVYVGVDSTSPPGDYRLTSYLGYNLRYGITDRLEVNTQMYHLHNTAYVKAGDKYNFSLQQLDLKYLVTKKPIYKTKASVIGGVMLDVFDNTTYFSPTYNVIFDFPFVNWYHLGVFFESELPKNFLLRYNTTLYYDYRPIYYNHKSGYRRTTDINFQLQWKLKRFTTFAEYALGSIWNRELQFGAAYTINDKTQLMAAYGRDLRVINKPTSENFITHSYKLGVYKSF